MFIYVEMCGHLSVAPTVLKIMEIHTFPSTMTCDNRQDWSVPP